MAGRVHAFALMMRAFKAIGLARPTNNNAANRLWTVWNYLVICAGVVFTLIVLYETITSNASFYVKLTNTAFICTNTSMTLRVILMTIRMKELFSIFEKMEALLQHMETVNGTNSLPKLRKKCQWIAIGYSILYVSILFKEYFMAYVKYYYLGIEDPAPFEDPIPFEKRHNIHAVVWYQVFRNYPTVATYAVTNICFLTISLATAELIRKLAECYGRINSSNANTLLKQTTRWHSEVVGLVNETNSLFGDVMMIEFLFSLIYISIAGFLLIKVGSTDSTKLSKHITMYIGFLSAPSAICIGGHLVTLENDALHIAVQKIEWYQMTPKARKDLILPTIISSKGLSWNYRGFVYFDMPLYLEVVKQSYTYISFLKIMG